MSQQLELLRPYIDERVQSLVRSRLLDGLKFFDGHALRPGYTRPEVKLALILVKIANPVELLNKDEQKLITEGVRQIQINAFKPHSSSSAPKGKSARSKKR